jgi:hypothetical protein
LLGQWVDLDKTRVYSSRESTELGDETDVALSDWLVGVRADDAAGDGAESAYARAESVDHALTTR